MSPRDWRLRVEDILESIQKITRYLDGMTLDEFTADERTMDAVIRNFTIVGEAARHVPDEVVARAPGLPWQEMRGLRNVVVHAYFGVSADVLWTTARDDLPAIVPALRALLEDEAPPSGEVPT